MTVLLGEIENKNLSIVSRDNARLSTDLDNFTWLGYPYSAAIETKDLGYTSYTNNLPFSMDGATTILGAIEPTYFFDWYFRIHIVPDTLNLNLVLSNQIQHIEVWNSYFTNQNLSSITKIETTGLTLTSGIAETYTFTPLYSNIYTLNVSPNGPPTINATYVFNFSLSYYFYITGIRLAIWPFIPILPYSEFREYLTDVIFCRDKEQRLTLREAPREYLSHKYIFSSNEEFSYAKTLANYYSDTGIATPYWLEATQLTTNVALNSTQIFFNTTNLELAVGSLLLIYTNYLTYHIGEISEITSTYVILSSAISKAFITPWLVPIKPSLTLQGVNFTRKGGGYAEANIEYINLESFYSASWWDNTLYKSLPIFPFVNIMKDNLSEKILKTQEIFDNTVGHISQLELESYTRFYQTIGVLATTKAERYALRRAIDYLNGRTNAFWLPTFNNDLTTSQNIVIGQSSLIVKKAYWAEYGFKAVRIIGSNTANFTILSVTDNGDGTENLVFEENSTVNISNITHIYVLSKVRLDTDRIEFSVNKHNMFCTIPVIEVNE